MGVITKPYTFSPNTTIESAQVNSDFDTLYTEVNGNLDNSNIKAGAGVSVSKLAGGTSGQVLKTSGSTPTWGTGTQTVTATRPVTSVSTTNTSYEDVPLLTVPITTSSGTKLRVTTKLGAVRCNVTNERAFFIVNIDGVDEGDESIIVHESPAGGTASMTLTGVHIKTGLAAGAHIVKIRWKSGAGNTCLLGMDYAGSELIVDEY